MRNTLTRYERYAGRIDKEFRQGYGISQRKKRFLKKLARQCQYQ